MEIDAINILGIVYVIYFMLPAYIANVSALVFGGGPPLDLGYHFIDKRRLIGDGVTWRGSIIGTLLGTLIDDTGHLVDNIPYGVLLGFLLAPGAAVGDACGSFNKRRLNIERGGPAPILDQLDFAIGAMLLASIIVNFTWEIIVMILIITVVLHLSANIIAYLIGLKDVWY
ncbi:MAG: CDP-2,3-bis-(O-geranylgeranyl)-sn-glycerol synthase [Coprothermobacter sp.]|nr:CDP-2,3-bis-(O-geranylgeranyl)-sn-glycerol synthase [Coprothermobacter sp.]